MEDILTWPEGVAAATGASTVSLQRRRALGDAPKLYAVTERRLVTTRDDLLAWVRQKEVPASYKCREATRRTSTRRPNSAGSVFDSDLDD